MSNIVVMGAGIGGLAAAFELRERLGREHEVVLVSDSSNFEFTPSNPWVAVRWRKPESIRIDLHEILPGHGIRFIDRGVRRVQPENNSLLLEGGETLSYRFLVIACGPRLAFDEVPGLGPHGGFTQSVCKTDHATLMADEFEAFCKNPGPVIVGAAQGASCFGPAYEFAFILDTELRKRRIRDRVPMTFVTPEPYIGHLGLDGVGDTKSLMESEMRNRHIKWHTNTRIEAVEEGVMHLATVNDAKEVSSRHDIPFTRAMILPAFTGVAAVSGIDGLVNPRGFVLVDKHQRNPAFTNVYALGVCVAIPPVGPTPLPVGVPKTGFMIESMVTAAVNNIALELAGRQPTESGTWNAFCLADFGDRGVAFMALPQIPPRNTNWSGSGRWVHWAKVAFEKYYLRKMRQGKVEPFFERYAMRLLGAHKLKDSVRLG